MVTPAPHNQLHNQLHDQLNDFRRGALYCDVSDRTQLEVSGPDATKFLHNFTTQEVKTLKPGQPCETFLCDVRGKTIGHGYVYQQADSLVIETVAGQAETLLAHLDRYLIAEDVELSDRTQEWGLAALFGQQAEDILAKIESLTNADGFELRETPIYGPGGFHLRCPQDAVGEVLNQLAQAGAAAAELETRESIRIAAATPVFGVDITAENFPQEINRDAQAISFDKGCYLGQETVARIDALGRVNWSLVGAVGGSEMQTNSELHAADKPAGKICSVAPHPLETGRAIAFALVRREHAAGSALESEHGAVELIELPLSLGE